MARISCCFVKQACETSLQFESVRGFPNICGWSSAAEELTLAPWRSMQRPIIISCGSDSVSTPRPQFNRREGGARTLRNPVGMSSERSEQTATCACESETIAGVVSRHQRCGLHDPYSVVHTVLFIARWGASL